MQLFAYQRYRLKVTILTLLCRWFFFTAQEDDFQFHFHFRYMQVLLLLLLSLPPLLLKPEIALLTAHIR